MKQLLAAESSDNSKKTYRRLNELLCASAYSSSLQGRVHAIDGLTNRSLAAILRDDAVLSSAFKTCMSYGLQPVTISDVFRIWLRIFMT